MSHCTRLREVASGSMKAKLAGCAEASGGRGSGRLTQEGRPGLFGSRVGPRVRMVKVRVSARSTVRTWVRVGAKARCMTIGEGCAGQRAQHMTFRPRVGVGAVGRGRVRDGGGVPDKVGAWNKVGSGVMHEVRGRA